MNVTTENCTAASGVYFSHNEDCVTEMDDSNFESMNELRELRDLNVWGESQEVLEKRALEELEIFASQNQNKSLDNVDVEGTQLADDQKNKHLTLDINRYIKSQEDLRKRQEHKRSLKISEESRVLAKKVSSHDKHSLNADIKKRRRKNSSSSTTRKKVFTKYKEKCGNNDNCSNSDYVLSDYTSSGSDYETCSESPLKRGNKNTLANIKDDGCLKSYKLRLEEYYKTVEIDCQEHSDAIKPDVVVKGVFRISYKTWNNLYSYQQEGVKWLLGLHQQTTGGLLGDEMGLGKTVQVIVFLAAVQNSHYISCHGRYKGLGPTLIVVPATIIYQWVKHFHDWTPEIRVAVLHQSGNFTGTPRKLVQDINKGNGVLLTTYSGILKHKDLLFDFNWHYFILDEGHKIRNSGSKVSVAVKQLHTPHRLMLTGSPMQNNLQELWSLFDFVVPGKLGSLPTFMEHFATPIMNGGYSNATPIQEATALSTATALKELIYAHLLRRSKDEVKEYIFLPHKSEQVLFCSMTDEQRDLYKGYLMGEHVGMILGRGGKNYFSENRMRSNMLVAITTLRKICNHPDIYAEAADDYSKETEDNSEQKYGFYKRSGKMIVVSALLKIWKKQKHRVLLFTQSRAMIIIFEAFLMQQGYKYLKMDGNTSITARQPLINKFNEDSSYDVFLLTTKVGGLGVNLTGANRVIIYDPDWNPATDTQARERAWRIGQEKQVTIYRLLSGGTIEEKIYQRQVWKQLLSNKILLDPRTQKFFKTSDLYDLFSFTESNESNPETANIFRNSRINLQERIHSKKQEKKEHSSKEKHQFSDDKVKEMKNLAQQIAKNIGHKNEAPVVRKTSYQLELEEERNKKLQERETLKKLTPLELRNLNRRKLEEQKKDDGNEIDNFDANISFSNALKISEKTAKLYNDIKDNKISDKEGTNKYCKIIGRNKHSISKEKHKADGKIDTSGVVDGERVEGLLKREVKKHTKYTKHNDNQDDFILEKLFSKKGVHSALEHDTIIQGTSKPENQFKLKWEAQQKTEIALQALRKSRLNNWQW
ncbi:hypothetical protein FQA39_LY10481 [Lamprigera yunnana]|nr:hypothetical protein FQA39_LY10481 [Lamprigera yunnana]